jgi:hypothetical protein
MTIDKFSNLSQSNPEIKFGPTIFFKKEALQVFWVQRYIYDLLSQWVIYQSINKSIYKLALKLRDQKF